VIFREGKEIERGNGRPLEATQVKWYLGHSGGGAPTRTPGTMGFIFRTERGREGRVSEKIVDAHQNKMSKEGAGRRLDEHTTNG